MCAEVICWRVEALNRGDVSRMEGFGMVRGDGDLRRRGKVALGVGYGSFDVVGEFNG